MLLVSRVPLQPQEPVRAALLQPQEPVRGVLPQEQASVPEAGQGQPSPRFLQVVLAVPGQEVRAAPQEQEVRASPQELQFERVFQGRLPQEQVSRVPQGVLP